MKKMKKALAFVLAMVMTLAMTVTAFGATETTKIVVTNLSTRESTVVSIYNVAELSADGNGWVIAEWAKAFVDTSKADAEFDWDNLARAAQDVKADATKTADSDTLVFENVKTGAYLVLAQGEKVTYNVMGAVTYERKDTNPYIVAKDASIVAKSDSSRIEKETDDSFVKVGQEINFTITSTIPNNKKEFKIYDKMTNLALVDGTVDVSVGDKKVDVVPVDEEGVLVFDFANHLSEVGKTVVIKYTARVLDADKYVNTTWDNIVTENKVSVEGYTADLTVRKVDAESGDLLKGAKFKILKGDQTLKFLLVSTGVYKLYDEKVAAADAVPTEEVEATEGSVKVMGLDEGTYKVVETLAPVGYSINDDGIELTVTPDEEKNQAISLSADYKDTKLSSLPFTGGIGTTIFTIIGCLVMIGAATLFFINRRKTV